MPTPAKRLTPALLSFTIVDTQQLYTFPRDTRDHPRKAQAWMRKRLEEHACAKGLIDGAAVLDVRLRIADEEGRVTVTEVQANVRVRTEIVFGSRRLNENAFAAIPSGPYHVVCIDPRGKRFYTSADSPRLEDDVRNAVIVGWRKTNLVPWTCVKDLYMRTGEMTDDELASREVALGA